MATVIKDLGAVTAYAYAVAGGYTGTKEEFQALLGNIAEDLAEIEHLSVTVTTLPAGSSATASYSDGELSLGIPRGDTGAQGVSVTGVTLNQDYTLTFTFSSGSPVTVGPIRGDQGVGIGSVSKTGTSGNVDTYTIYSDESTPTVLGTFTVTNSNVSSVAGKTGAVTLNAEDVSYDGSATYSDGTVGEELSQTKSQISELDDAVEELDELLPIASESGAIVSFTDDTGNLPLKSVTATIAAVQSGTGTPSSENVRPIGGFTGLSVYKSGKNLLPLTVYNGGTYNPTVGTTLTLSVAGNAKQLTPNASRTAFTVSTSSNNTMFTLLCPVKGGLTYHVYFQLSGSSAVRSSKCYLDKDFKVLSRVNTTTNPQTYDETLTPSANVRYWALIFSNGSTASDTITLTNPQINLTGTKEPYEPYVGKDESLSWQSDAGTVYGGSVNPLTGKLTVTHANIASYAGEDINEPWISSIDEYASGATPSTGAQVVYPLTTPVEYSITPVSEILTEQGLNIFSANTGDIALTYSSGESGLNDSIGLTNTMKAEVEDIIWNETDSYGLSSDALLYVSNVPSYYIDPETTPTSFAEAQSYLDNKIDSIPKGGKSFVYITDVHWAGNEKHSTFLINYIRKRTGIQKVVFGGDVFGKADDKFLAAKICGDYLNQSKRAFGYDYMPCVGDHDNNTVNVSGEPEDTFLPYVQLEKLFMSSLKRNPDCHIYNPVEKLADYATAGTDDYNGALAFFHTVYYVDDKKQGIRYISLNTGNGGDYGSMYNVFGSSGSSLLRLQYDFVVDALMTTPSGWDIVVFSHKGTIEESGSSGTTLAKIIHGFKKANSVCKPYPASSTNAIDSWWPNTTQYDFSARPAIGTIITLDGHNHSDHLYWFGTSSGSWAFEQSLTSGDTIVQPDEITAGTTTIQIPAIVTATDSLDVASVSNPMTVDTVTEQCFDIVTILDDEIVLTRIGAGSDRSIGITKS